MSEYEYPCEVEELDDERMHQSLRRIRSMRASQRIHKR